MSNKEKKKSWKEQQRERQLKQQRAQEAHQIEREKEAKRKPRQLPKGKIIAAVCVLILVFGVIGAWQLTSSSTPSEEDPPVTPVTGVIYIRPDGQVSPTTAPVSKVDDTHYKLTADIYVPLMVGRDDIEIDGDNHAILGSNELYSIGVDLTGRSGVTVKNLEIAGFDYGVYLSSASDNVVSQNDFTNNYCAIWITEASNDNVVSENNVVNNEMWALFMKDSSNNVISENEIASHANYTIYVRHSNFTTFSGNTIKDNNLGIYFYEASDNVLYHNNFLNNGANDMGAISSTDSTNTYDNGNEGNYWSNYQTAYPDAEKTDGSGIWNTPYVIDDNNQDNFPLVDRWSS